MKYYLKAFFWLTSLFSTQLLLINNIIILFLLIYHLTDSGSMFALAGAQTLEGKVAHVAQDFAPLILHVSSVSHKQIRSFDPHVHVHHRVILDGVFQTFTSN